jgi:hypothetical protein
MAKTIQSWFTAENTLCLSILFMILVYMDSYDNNKESHHGNFVLSHTWWICTIPIHTPSRMIMSVATERPTMLHHVYVCTGKLEL